MTWSLSAGLTLNLLCQLGGIASVANRWQDYLDVWSTGRSRKYSLIGSIVGTVGSSHEILHGNLTRESQIEFSVCAMFRAPFDEIGHCAGRHPC